MKKYKKILIGFLCLMLFGQVLAQHSINITSFCWGNGNATPCPCGNNSMNDGTGCRNSTIHGAMLLVEEQETNETIILIIRGSVPGGLAILFSADNWLNHGFGFTNFGDGLRCVGGNAIREGWSTVGPDGIAIWNKIDINLLGIHKNFQVMYTDHSAPCDTGFNTTNGLSILTL